MFLTNQISSYAMRKNYFPQYDSRLIERILAHHKIGFDYFFKDLDDGIIKSIRSDFENGWTLGKIQDKYNIHRRRLSILITYLGLDTFKNQFRFSGEIITKKYIEDESYFETIDSEEKAYWLGFIFADGYIKIDPNKPNTKALELALAEKDISHLIKFKKAIKTDKGLYKKKVKLKDKTHIAYRLIVSNSKFCDNLIAKNLHLKKSGDRTFPSEEILPINLRNHFIRGYFDGDGCVWKSGAGISVGIMGSMEFLNCIVEELVNNIPGWTHTTYNQRNKEVEVYTMYKSGRHNLKKLFDYLYKDATVYLDRKYIKFKQLLLNQQAV